MSKVDISDVPEVQRFLEIEERLANLKDGYADVFEAYAALVEERNAALEDADKRLRAEKLSCGPFKLTRVNVAYDADRLYEELGHEMFMRVGGSIKTVTKYEVDKGKLEASAASGSVPANAIKAARKETCFYKKPEKLSV